MLNDFWDRLHRITARVSKHLTLRIVVDIAEVILYLPSMMQYCWKLLIWTLKRKDVAANVHLSTSQINRFVAGFLLHIPIYASGFFCTKSGHLFRNIHCPQFAKTAEGTKQKFKTTSNLLKMTRFETSNQLNFLNDRQFISILPYEPISCLNISSCFCLSLISIQSNDYVKCNVYYTFSKIILITFNNFL